MIELCFIDRQLLGSYTHHDLDQNVGHYDTRNGWDDFDHCIRSSWNKS